MLNFPTFIKLFNSEQQLGYPRAWPVVWRKAKHNKSYLGYVKSSRVHCMEGKFKKFKVSVREPIKSLFFWTLSKSGLTPLSLILDICEVTFVSPILDNHEVTFI